jgi:hypothetical protein
MKIEILQEDIDGAPDQDMPRSWSCPVARALTRITGVPCAAGRYGAIIGRNVLADGRYHVSFPYVVSSIIHYYDLSGVMFPFGFEADISPPE